MFLGFTSMNETGDASSVGLFWDGRRRTMTGKGPALCPAHDGEHAVTGPSSSIQKTRPGREEGGLGLQELLLSGVRECAGVPTSFSKDQDTEPSDGKQAPEASGTESPTAGLSQQCWPRVEDAAPCPQSLLPHQTLSETCTEPHLQPADELDAPN